MGIAKITIIHFLANLIINIFNKSNYYQENQMIDHRNPCNFSAHVYVCATEKGDSMATPFFRVNRDRADGALFPILKSSPRKAVGYKAKAP